MVGPALSDASPVRPHAAADRATALCNRAAHRRHRRGAGWTALGGRTARLVLGSTALLGRHLRAMPPGERLDRRGAAVGRGGGCDRGTPHSRGAARGRAADAPSCQGKSPRARSPWRPSAPYARASSTGLVSVRAHTSAHRHKSRQDLIAKERMGVIVTALGRGVQAW